MELEVTMKKPICRVFIKTMMGGAGCFIGFNPNAKPSRMCYINKTIDQYYNLQPGAYDVYPGAKEGELSFVVESIDKRCYTWVNARVADPLTKFDDDTCIQTEFIVTCCEDQSYSIPPEIAKTLIESGVVHLERTSKVWMDQIQLILKD